jgi:kumamolisin
MIAFPNISSLTTISNNPNDSITNYVDGLHVTPTIISTAYNIPASQGANVKVGIVSLGGGWLPADLQKSLSNIGVTLTQNITSVLVDGAGNVFSTSDSNASLENTLDLYCVAGMAPSANIVLYIGQNSVSGFANVVNRAVREDCDVISISWGGSESYGSYLETAFANASAKGITVCVASGDYGSENVPGGGYLGPLYPASSPNVVAVGGTVLNYNTSTYARNSESVSIYSGGGISTLFSVPTWQTGLQANLFFSSNGYSSVSTITGRGVPDIAAPYQTYPLWYNNGIAQAVGTSAAAPIIAGMFARYVSLTGRRPIPTAIHKILYQNNNAYSDISIGNNLSYLTVGFVANVGWDPIIGLGAPIGNVVYQMVTSGGTTIKTAANTWNYVANVRVKTAANTWSNVQTIYTKTINGWQQSY